MKKYSADDFRREIRKAVRLEVIPSNKIRDQQIVEAFKNIRGNGFKVFVVGVTPKVAKGIGSIFKVSIEVNKGRQRPAYQYFDHILRSINVELVGDGMYFEDVSNVKQELEGIYSKDFVGYFMK